jgi:hypothetical protein
MSIANGTQRGERLKLSQLRIPGLLVLYVLIETPTQATPVPLVQGRGQSRIKKYNGSK